MTLRKESRFIAKLSRKYIQSVNSINARAKKAVITPFKHPTTKSNAKKMSSLSTTNTWMAIKAIPHQPSRAKRRKKRKRKNP